MKRITLTVLVLITVALSMSACGSSAGNAPNSCGKKVCINGGTQ